MNNQDKPTEKELIKAVVLNYYPPRRWAVCPNVSWGVLPWEADVFAVSKAGMRHEVEVKVNKNDLKNDSSKRKWQNFDIYNFIDYYWICVPLDLKEEGILRANELQCGLYVCTKMHENWICEKILSPKKRFKKQRENNQIDIYRLCALRYWKIIQGEIKW